MIGTIRVKVGRASMIIKGKDAAAIEADLRRVYQPMIDAGKERADKVHAAMLLTWPIFTGRTRESFHPFIALDPARYRLEVGYRTENENVWYVYSGKRGKRRNAMEPRWALQSDLLKPMKEQVKPYAAESAELLRAALRRAFNG